MASKPKLTFDIAILMMLVFAANNSVANSGEIAGGSGSD
jgi:hypothetical protein